MRKKIICIFLCLMLLPLGACSAVKKKNIILVTDASGINGNYYNSETYKALSTLSGEYNFNLTLISPERDVDYEASIEKAVSQKPDLIIVSSPELEIEVILIAMQNLTVNFCLIGAKCDLDMNGVSDSPNIFSIVFDRSEEGFLCGVFSAMLAKDTLFVGEYEYASFVEYEAGFIAGMKCSDTSCDFTSIYLSSNAEDDVVKQALDENKPQGEDALIYTYSTDKRIYKFSADNGIALISSGFDKTAFFGAGSGEFLFYVKENVDVAVKYMLDIYFEGRFKGQIKELTAKDNAFGVIYAVDDKISDIVRNKVNTYFYALSEGKLNIPKTKESAAKFIIPELSDTSVVPLSLSDIINTVTD